jgi:hypothetical protein
VISDLHPEAETAMSRRRVIVPGPGNPMRPILLFIAGAFGAFLIVFPTIMRLAGVGWAGTIGVAILIIVTAVICLAMLKAVSGVYERDQADLLGGDAWAQWQLTPAEHERFVADERRRYGRQAASSALVGLVLGPVLGVVADDWLLCLILMSVFMVAAVVILAMVRPRRAGTNARARDVIVGPRGVYLLGRYLPLQGLGIRVTHAVLEPGDPAVMRFDVRSGRRLQEVVVPVTSGHLHDAKAVVERFLQESG